MEKNKQLLDFFESTNKKALDWLKEQGRLGLQAENVLRAICLASDGLTDEEGCEILGIRHTSFIARRHDIMKAYPDLLVSDSYRIGSSGHQNRVWRIDQCRQ